MNYFKKALYCYTIAHRLICLGLCFTLFTAFCMLLMLFFNLGNQEYYVSEGTNLSIVTFFVGATKSALELNIRRVLRCLCQKEGD
jgi:hypothetical protein